jgi:fatty-acyl-CoA synthase
VQLAAAVGRPDLHAGELPVVYVQLKPGRQATEEELHAFAKTQIPERAAHPKAIRLVPTLPLTSVGKIFKPELRQREIADALHTSLREAGAPASALIITNHLQLGIHVQATVYKDDLLGTARSVLGKFPFHFSVVSEASNH